MRSLRMEGRRLTVFEQHKQMIHAANVVHVTVTVEHARSSLGLLTVWAHGISHDNSARGLLPVTCCSDVCARACTRVRCSCRVSAACGTLHALCSIHPPSGRYAGLSLTNCTSAWTEAVEASRSWDGAGDQQCRGAQYQQKTMPVAPTVSQGWGLGYA